MIGIGIIGAGHFGAVHARAIARLETARLVAVCRNDPEGASAFASQHGGTPYTDWKDLLADKLVDAVVIATPHHLHQDITEAALAAGKHVLLEKPMAETPEACAKINAAAHASKSKLMIGHVMHFHRPVMMARAIIKSGDLGRPVVGIARFSKLWMEGNRRDWHLSAVTGGGMLFTAGIHALDGLVHLMDGSVTGVSALSGTLFHDQKAEDTSLLNLRFADGRFGHVASIGYSEGAVTHTIDVICERGTISVDLNAGLRVGKKGEWTAIPDSLDPDGMDGAVFTEWQVFIDSITLDRASPIDGMYGAHIVEIIDTAHRSAQLRSEVEIEQ